MPNKSSIRTSVLKLLSEHSMISSSDVNTIIETEHQEILENYSWARRKIDTLITLAATYSTGTVATSGTTVTGTNTTFTSSMVGRFIRIGSNNFFHRITAFGSTTSLTIEDSLPTDASSGSSYTIFRHLYNLPSNFGRVLNVTLSRKLVEASRSEIDRIDAYRTSTASYPSVYSIHGLDPDTTSSQIFQIEFWPVPSTANAVRIEYLKTNTLSSDSDEPLYRSDVLVWKAAESGAFFLHSKTGDQAWLSLADRYHARYTESLQGAREDDIGKYSPVSYVRDAGLEWNGPSDDFLIRHDTLLLP